IASLPPCAGRSRMIKERDMTKSSGLPEGWYLPKKAKRNVSSKITSAKEHNPTVEYLNRRYAELKVEETPDEPFGKVTVERVELALAVFAYIMTLDDGAK